MLVISSGDIYGDQLVGRSPPPKTTPLRPSNPYSVSKVTQDMLALQYFISDDLPIMRARPFNHLGPGQSPGFVAPDFGLQIARIEAGQQEPIMRVGSLTAERDFTDVRDVVRAYRLIMEQRHRQAKPTTSPAAKPGTIQRSARHIAARYSHADIRVEIDPARLRPGSISKVVGRR